MKTEKAKELALVSCIIRDNHVIDSTLFQSFDKIYEIAEAFVEKYGYESWSEDLDFEEEVVKFSKAHLVLCKI